MSERKLQRTAYAEALFRQFCRQRGTRCAAIMAAIERGEDLKDVAARFGTDKRTAKVYAKALRDELCAPVVDHERPDVTPKNTSVSKGLAVFEKTHRYEDLSPNTPMLFNRAAVRRLFREAGYTEASGMREAGFSEHYLEYASEMGRLSMRAVRAIKSELDIDLIAEGAVWIEDVL